MKPIFCIILIKGENEMIEIIDLTKKFKNKIALDSVNVSFNKGVYGLLGPNGAGKTTLMRSILGLYKIQTGKILYNNINIKKDTNYTLNIGYLPQKFGLFLELTIYEMMQYLATLKRINKNKQKKEIGKCVDYVNLADHMNDKIGSLSGGMIRRLGIAQALLGDPKVIIVDEPTAGLDPEERIRFKNLISFMKDECTIIISTHIVEDVEALCSDIVIINNGKIIGNGRSDSIRNIAKNKVFNISADKEKELVGEYFIEKRSVINDENILRVISNTVQGGKLVQPTIEDGYMCRIKGLG